MLLFATFLSVAVGCPSVCRCSGRGRVYCNDKNLKSIPYGIPVDTKTLFLQNNRLINSPELNSRLSELPQLERLMLYNNELVEFPAIRSITLREMDVNGNQIERVSNLVKLNNLDRLNLDDNSLSTSHLDFSGMPHLRQLSLNKNLFSTFPTGLPASIENLILSNNKITTISAKSVESLSSVQNLRLDHNKINDQVKFIPKIFFLKNSYF